MKIAVVGTGYVGLVTGTCFAESGNNVTCIDIDKEKVALMQSGKIPIYEPGLEILFSRNISEKRLTFTESLKDGIKDAEVIFLALPTPSGDDGSADLTYVLNVSEDLGKLIDKYVVIVDKSTVPVGTSEKVTQALRKSGSNNFSVVSNPEFLREGFAVNDFLNPDRIVIGSSSEKAKAVMSKLYSTFTQSGANLIFMDERSAEMTKYAANSFLATKISFMNEIANLCEKVGANVDFVRQGIGSDERIGHRFLFPGIGYGGSCFPKDVKALDKTAKESGYNFEILNAVMNVNEKQKNVLVDKILKQFGDIAGMKFAIWGLAFKPDTDDVREAPALRIIESLINLGAKVAAYDPEAVANIKKHHPYLTIEFSKTMYDATKNANALIIATEWSEFKSPDFKILRQNLKQPIIFDGRNIYNIEAVEKEGFKYFSIGR